MSDIKSAIDAVYHAFARVPCPDRLEACECCIDDKQRQQLISQSLREIDPFLMSVYGSAAARPPSQFLYFLPRHLEIACSDEGWCPEPESIGLSIGESAPASWTVEQRDAVDCLFKLIVRRSLAPERHEDIDTWLCCIAHADFPLRHHLSYIVRSQPAVLSYFCVNPQVMERRLGNPHWTLPNSGHDEIVDWFHSTPVRDILYDEYHLSW